MAKKNLLLCAGQGQNSAQNLLLCVEQGQNSDQNISKVVSKIIGSNKKKWNLDPGSFFFWDRGFSLRLHMQTMQSRERNQAAAGCHVSLGSLRSAPPLYWWRQPDVFVHTRTRRGIPWWSISTCAPWMSCSYWDQMSQHGDTSHLCLSNLLWAVQSKT